jgi:hypothetical protein
MQLERPIQPGFGLLGRTWVLELGRALGCPLPDIDLPGAHLHVCLFHDLV